jgi:hypothetical protein
VTPGVHEFSFSARVGPWPGRDVSTTQTISIDKGQRGPIAVALPSADPPEDEGVKGTWPPAPTEIETPVEATKAPDKPLPDAPPREAEPTVTRSGGPSAFAYVLGGVGALGLGAGALLTYWGKTDNAALAQCTPNCQPSSVEHIRGLYLAADLSFGAGAAAVGVSTLLFATSHFDVRPVRSGAVASVGGGF